MRIIKDLSRDIECNIREAEEKINTAYSLLSTYPAAAVWYRDMAMAHLNFNNKAHDLVTAEISKYRVSSEYAEHPEYADGMMAVWQDRHNDIVSDSAKVRAMIDNFKAT